MGIIIPAILGGFLAKTMIDIATYYQYRYPMGDYEMRRLYKIEEVPKWQSTIAEAIAVFGTEMASETLSIYMGGRLAEHLLKKYADDLLEKVYYKLSPKLWNIERRLNRRTKNIDRFLCNFSNDFKNRKGNDILEKAVEQAMKDLKYAKMYKRYANESTKTYKQSELRSVGLFGLQIFEWGIEWLIWMENLGQTVRKQIEFGMENLLRIINNIPWDIDMTRDELRRLAESGMGGKELAEKITREDRRTNEILLRLKQLIEFKNALRDFRLKRDEFRKDYKNILEKQLDKYNKDNEIKTLTQQEIDRYLTATQKNTITQYFYEEYDFYTRSGSGNGIVYKTYNKNDYNLNMKKSGICGYGYAALLNLYFGSCSNKVFWEGYTNYKTDTRKGYNKKTYKFIKDKNYSYTAEESEIYTYEIKSHSIRTNNDNKTITKIIEKNIKSYKIEGGGGISKTDAFILLRTLKNQNLITKEQVEAYLDKQATKIKNKYNYIITRLQNRLNQQLNYLYNLKLKTTDTNELQQIDNEINRIQSEYTQKINEYEQRRDTELTNLQNNIYYYDNVEVRNVKYTLFSPYLYVNSSINNINYREYRKNDGNWQWYNYVEKNQENNRDIYIVRSGHFGNEYSYYKKFGEGLNFSTSYAYRSPPNYAATTEKIYHIIYTFYRKKKRYINSSIVKEISKSIDYKTCIVFKKVLTETATKTVKLENSFYLYSDYHTEEEKINNKKTKVINKLKQSYIYISDDKIEAGTYDSETKTIITYRVIFTDNAIEYINNNYEYEDKEYKFEEIFENITERTIEKKGNRRRKFICLR